MDTSAWRELYKFADGHPCRATTIYVPLVNELGTVFCMDFGNAEIQFDNTFFFLRELEFLNKFKDYDWAPNVLSIDRDNKKVYISWNTDTCNTIINSDRTLDEVCPDWKKQLAIIINQLLAAGVYKLTLYPHCFYVDNTGKLRTTDFYGCVPQHDTQIPKSVVENIMSKSSAHRWAEATAGDTVDFKIFFMRAIEEHIHEWPGIKLQSLIYE